MPIESFGATHAFLARPQLLTFEEITRLARIACAQGVGKIRLTGGEPLLRRGIEDLIRELATIPKVDLALTTNGALLARQARALKAAGLARLTVSLDALDEDVFCRMNGVAFPVATVVQGIHAAIREGFAQIKINVVVQRGVNEQQILPLCRYFRGTGCCLRFIEYMDVGCSNGWDMSHVLPSAEVIGLINQVYPLEPLEANGFGETSQRWRYRDGAGEIGVISSVTRAFCSECSRIRLSPDGKLYTCLFAEDGQDIKNLMRSGADDLALAGFLEAVWGGRSDRYSELRQTIGSFKPLRRVEMSYIGG